MLSRSLKLLFAPNSFRIQFSSSASESVSRIEPASKTRPVRLCFLGAPGVGKGTFATRIGPLFKIPAISSGDLVREEIKKNTELGRRIKQINDQGLLVGDDIITEMIRVRLKKSDAAHGFLLDGFPRRVTQAESLNKISKLDLVLNISLREDVLIQKACARRVCASCGKNYNVANIQSGDIQMPPLLPKVAGKCDNCSNGLIQRDDDKEEVVRKRLQVYHSETHPLVQYYLKQGILHTFEVKTGIADLPKILKLLEGSLKR